ncbi:MAG: hypothetical protein ACK5Q5_18305 [Planctomycetaceae bacterium]
MPTEVKSQPISGVAAGQESLLESVYPSMSSSFIGRLIGSLCDSIPIKIAGIQLSHVLFAPLAIPFALVGYFMSKIVGDRYEITNRSVRVRKIMGGQLLRQVALMDLADVLIDQQAGQAFYKAADLQVVNAKGDVLLTLPAVVRPERLRHVILEARQARLQADASLKTIQARK